MEITTLTRPIIPSIPAAPALTAPTAGPLDAFTPSLGGVAAGGFVTMLGVRVPTVTPEISEERRQEILTSIQPGDVILETDNAYPGWQRMEFYTMRSSFTHAAIYEGDGKFLEATTPGGVQRTDLDEYLHGRVQIAVIRPEYKTTDDVKATLDFCRAQLGKAYDNKFDTHDNKEFYCAEYVWKGLQAAPNRIDVPTRHFFKKEVVAPDSFFQTPNAKVIYNDGSKYWKNRLSNWPVYASAAAGAAAGAHVGGIAGGAAGLVGGALLSILVGNKIQTGHFNLAGEPKGHHPR